MCICVCACGTDAWSKCHENFGTFRAVRSVFVFCSSSEGRTMGDDTRLEEKGSDLVTNSRVVVPDLFEAINVGVPHCITIKRDKRFSLDTNTYTLRKSIYVCDVKG